MYDFILLHQTVVKYYHAACEYGVQTVKEDTFKWLEVNLLSYYTDRPVKLRKFSSKLLTELVSSPDLFVMQTEYSVYLLLRAWLYFNIYRNSDNEPPNSVEPSDINAYFYEREGKY